MISTNLELSLKHCNLALGDTIFEAEVNQDTVVGVGTTYITYDIHNFTGALNIVLNTSAEEREKNAEQARKALDKLRPENIKGKWNYCCRAL